MNYQDIFEQLGFVYKGPCSCRHAKGYIYQSNVKPELQLWIYPFKKEVKQKIYDSTKSILKYSTDAEMESVINQLAA